jgi:hypothetical protein
MLESREIRFTLVYEKSAGGLGSYYVEATGCRVERRDGYTVTTIEPFKDVRDRWYLAHAKRFSQRKMDSLYEYVVAWDSYLATQVERYRRYYNDYVPTVDRPVFARSEYTNGGEDFPTPTGEPRKGAA